MYNLINTPILKHIYLKKSRRYFFLHSSWIKHTPPFPALSEWFSYQWEGVFVPVVPLKLMDVLDSPVPALVGVQAPFEVPVLDSLGYDYEGVVVLDLDARPPSVRFDIFFFPSTLKIGWFFSHY